MRLRPFLRRFKTDLISWSRFTAVSLVCTGTVMGGAFAAYAAVWPAVVGHSYFQLRSVKVACDSGVVRPGVLASRAGLFDGTSVWEVDPERASAALAAAPWVRSARVSRRFPSHVSVEVLRREPVAATFSADGPYLIDRDGMIYREEGKIPHFDLPYITGWQRAETRAGRVHRLRTAMALIAAADRSAIHLSQIHIDDDDSYWIYPEAQHVAVRLGERPEAGAMMPRLRAVLSTLPTPAPDIREIDLSYPDRAVLRVSDGRARRVASMLASTRRDRVATEANDRG